MSHEIAESNSAFLILDPAPFPKLALVGLNILIAETATPSMIDMLAEGDEEERAELERDFEMEVMPELRERFAKIAAVMSAWHKEQASRIYGAV